MNQRALFLKHVAQTSDVPFLGVDLNIVSAKGSILTDVNGKQFYDFISGISVSSIGHCHDDVVTAIKSQADKFMHLMVYGEYNQSPQVKYAKVLTDLLPEKLNCVYFTTGGSEAIEGAMKLAKRATGRSEIISFKNAYHGSTQGALSLMGDEFFKNSFRPLLPDIKILAYNDLNSVSQISSNTAAVFVEVIQGEAGVVEGSKEFLNALRKKCDEHCTLLIVDEIQTGFGRTGKLFAFEHYDFVPDVLIVAKALGGGLPIGAFISSTQLMSVFTNNPVLGHINTFGGNALCVEAANASLQVIIRENLSDRAVWIEQVIRESLNNKKIKALNLKGALGAIHFESEEICFNVIKSCIENGVLSDWFLFCSNAMRIAPPLNIKENELIDSLKKINNAINKID
jgi:acetylornithine/succinyldiaminopimelate/putrescine aminotransferase